MLHHISHISVKIVQITVERPLAGTYIVRISGIRMLVAPQSYSVVVTGASPCVLDVQEVRTSACLSDCSGHGQCVTGRCVCEAAYVGHGCEVRVYPLSTRAGPPTVVKINSNGWAYLSFLVSQNQNFVVTVSNQGDADVSLFVGNSGPPSMSNHIWGSAKPLKKDVSDSYAKDAALPRRYARV